MIKRFGSAGRITRIVLRHSSVLTNHYDFVGHSSFLLEELDEDESESACDSHIKKKTTAHTQTSLLFWKSQSKYVPKYV